MLEIRRIEVNVVVVGALAANGGRRSSPFLASMKVSISAYVESGRQAWIFIFLEKATHATTSSYYCSLVGGVYNNNRKGRLDGLGCNGRRGAGAVGADGGARAVAEGASAGAQGVSNGLVGGAALGNRGRSAASDVTTACFLLRSRRTHAVRWKALAASLLLSLNMTLLLSGTTGTY